MAEPPAVEIHVERPSRKTIWLDTNVLINIARARQGKKADARAKAIGDAVAAKIASQQLLCLEAEQRAEMRDSRLVQETLDHLSMGARMRPFYEVQRRQLVAGLAGQLAGKSSITFPRSMFYERDPADDVDEG